MLIHKKQIYKNIKIKINMNKANIKFISSKNNELIIDIGKLKEKKHRDKTGLFFVEGFKLFEEALRANSAGRGCKIKYILAVEDVADEALRIAGDEIEVSFIVTTKEVYKKISAEESAQGIMCVISKPLSSEEIDLSYQTPVIILDAVRDAGNVGTIIRSANALCECEFIFTHDCADLYNPKTLRAAMGANFYQKVKICENLNNITNEVAKLKENGYNIFAAFLDKTAKSIEDVSFNAKTAVIFGNEGKGISDDILNLCDEKIIIPINENSESLNVSIAAGIVFWEMKKTKK